MKKIILFLLLSIAGYGQVSTGGETDFDYGIKNNAAQTVTTPINIVTQGTDGTYGKALPANLPISYAVIDSLKLKENINTGFISGLVLSINADNTKFDIAPGIYAITDYADLQNPVSKIIVYPGATGITPTYLATANATYIELDVNGAIIQSSSPFTNTDRRTKCIIGAAIHSNNINIGFVNEIKAPIVSSTNQLHDLMRYIGALNISGNVYMPNGANLQLNKSAGVIAALGINPQNYLDPNTLAIAEKLALTFRYRTQTGIEGANITSIDTNTYDVAGTITTVPVNKWTVQRYNLFQSGETRAQRGQNLYNSFSEALTGFPTATFVTEQNIAENAVFRAFLIVKQGTTDLQAAVLAGTAKFIPVDKFGNIVSGGSIALTYANIVAALGFTPENVANKQNSLAIDGTGTFIPTVDAVNNSTVNFDPKNTKIAFIGDSITYGVGSSSGSTSYSDILNTFFGFQTYTKLATGGMTVKPGAGAYLSQKISEIPIGTNYITVMLGINDWGNNNVIGDVNIVMAKSYASLDETLSFAEAFRYNMETIKNTFPNAEIRIITPIKHDATWVRDLDFKFYVEAEIQIANFLSIPVINAYDASGIFINSTSQYIPDGVHPNDAGYLSIANFLKKGLIDNTTQHNSNSFYNSLVVGKQELRSLNGGEAMRITGKSYLSPNDNVNGVSLGLLYNSSGIRIAYLGGTDNNKKLLFNENAINAYNFSTNSYEDLAISPLGKRVSIGSVLGQGNLLNIGNYNLDPTNKILGISGAVAQTGNYINVSDSAGNIKFKVDYLGKATASNGLLVGSATVTPNFLQKSVTSESIGNSSIFDDGTKIGFKTASPLSNFNVEAPSSIVTNFSNLISNSNSFFGGYNGGFSNFGIALYNTATSSNIQSTFGGGSSTLSLNPLGGNVTMFSFSVTTPPTTSASAYDFLTRNTSTGVVEKINTNIALTGIPTAPTATVGTNTTQIATTAFAQGIRPYKVYTALLSQTGTSDPTAIVLENTIGAIVWSRTVAGGYFATLTGAFTTDKTSVSITNGSSNATYIHGAAVSTANVNVITVDDGQINRATIEIRVYN